MRVIIIIKSIDNYYGQHVDTQTLLGVVVLARRWAKPVCVFRRV